MVAVFAVVVVVAIVVVVAVVAIIVIVVVVVVVVFSPQNLVCSCKQTSAALASLSFVIDFHRCRRQSTAAGEKERGDLYCRDSEAEKRPVEFPLTYWRLTTYHSP